MSDARMPPPLIQYAGAIESLTSAMGRVRLATFDLLHPSVAAILLDLTAELTEAVAKLRDAEEAIRRVRAGFIEAKAREEQAA